jgi:hypothetical protein
MHMRWHESNGQDPTPCFSLLFLSLLVTSTSISVVDILLVGKHACMRAHACACISTSINIVDMLLVFKHGCMHVRRHESHGQAPMGWPSSAASTVSVAGGDIKINWHC